MRKRPVESTIGALSKRTACNIETIRYYERIGMLPAPPRTAGGHRVYSELHIKRLTFIRRSRELGFSLDQIRELLALVDGADLRCEDIQTLTLSHLDEVRQKITDLQSIEKVLVTMAAQCSGGQIPQCPIVEALFDAAT